MEHAGALQSCILNAGLVPGEKYTLVYYSEFGFPVMDDEVCEMSDSEKKFFGIETEVKGE